MSDSNLPVKTTEEFLAENEVMDLSPLKSELFLVAVSTGDRNKSKFLSTTVRGPYSYTEMLEEVGVMWKEQQHHAKAVILSKDRNARLKTLDENTVDYIECHYLDLITDAMLEGAFDKEYTCRAGIVEEELPEPEKVQDASG
jgi:hypothetical protein